MGVGERCGGGRGLTWVKGGVRGPRKRVPTTRPKRARQWSAGLRPASPAQRAKLQGFLSPHGALAHGNGAATTARAYVARRLRFGFPRRGATALEVSRPAAAMPVGDRRSAAARNGCGGALWWWAGCDVREWRRAGFAAREGHETAFRQPARSAHGSGAPVSDRHRPRSGRNSRAFFRRMAPSPTGTARRPLRARTGAWPARRTASSRQLVKSGATYACVRNRSAAAALSSQVGCVR